MIVKSIQDEDYINFRIPSMLIATPICSGKCWKELGLESSLCQNEALLKQKNIEINDYILCERYLANDLTKAIVIAGLEPLDSLLDILDFIRILRENYQCLDPIVIYTGYKEDEVECKITELAKMKNIIVKFGRYDPINFPESIYDEVLGVKLATNNQYAKII